jgi:hypothetical protein
MDTNLGGITPYFTHTSFGLPGTEPAAAQVAAEQLRQNCIGIGWGYWPEGALQEDAFDLDNLKYVQTRWFQCAFGLTADFNPQRQLRAFRTAVKRLKGLRVGQPVIAHLPGRGIYGLGIVTEPYHFRQGLFTPKGVADNFKRVVNVAWAIKAPIVDGVPVCTQVDWAKTLDKFVPSSTISSLPLSEYENLVALMVAKYQ